MQPRDRRAALRRGRVATALALAVLVLNLAGCDGGNDDGSFRDDPTPFVSHLDERYAAFLEQCAADAATPGSSIHAQICALDRGTSDLDDLSLGFTLAKMDERQDTADFGLAALVRILAKYRSSPGVSADQLARIETTIRNFKYWIDEPGVDAMVYWSENHYVLFNSAAFVLGRLYPDTVFTNSGLTGSELRAKARVNLDRWLTWRLRWGFSEFHSDVYYNEDVAPLLNLADFGDDESIQVRARMAVDLFLYDMALNNHEGFFGVAHGRSYVKDKTRRDDEDTPGMIWLMSGKGSPVGESGSMSAVAMVTSDTYRVPAVIESVGSARPRGLETRERLSINVADGPSLGISHDDFDDGVLWWTMGAYVMPETINTTLLMASAWNLFDDPESFFALFAFAEPFAGTALPPQLARDAYPLTSGYALEQVNTYAYRTPEVMLASAQAWKPATLGAQTHAWQATLADTAAVFTTYPGDLLENEFAGHWTGGWHPRIAQSRTAAIILYDQPTYSNALVQLVSNALFPEYTHAFFPRGEFDEVREIGKWVLARKGDGYVALFSNNPASWVDGDEWIDQELRADGVRNAWICEVGDTTQYGSFDEFVAQVTSALVVVAGDLTVKYDSPGQGLMDFSWTGPLLVDGEEVSIGPYPRYESPYAVKEYDGADPYVIRRGGRSLTLDPATLTRAEG